MNVRLSGKAGTRRGVRRLIALVTLAAALFALGAFPAMAGGPNNVVLAESTADPVSGAAGTVVRSRVLTGSTGADVVTSTNLASAHSHDCTGCRATAVAFQAVVMTGAPHVASPRNIATAVNENCNSCVTFAFAYQYAVTADRSLQFSPEGLQGLLAFRQQVDNLANDPALDPAARLAELHLLEDDFRLLIDTAIREAGSRPEGRDDDEKVDAPPATPAAAQAPEPAPAPAG
jgi:putative peptide zinc metalloprotease protein